MTEGEHIDSPDCWCHPYVVYTAPDGGQVWVHRGAEPPLNVLAEAIAMLLENPSRTDAPCLWTYERMIEKTAVIWQRTDGRQ